MSCFEGFANDEFVASIGKDNDKKLSQRRNHHHCPLPVTTTLTLKKVVLNILMTCERKTHV